MGEVKIEAEYRNNPQLQKLAQALLSIARRQVAAGTAENASVTNPSKVKPEAGKDAA